LSGIWNNEDLVLQLPISHLPRPLDEDYISWLRCKHSGKSSSLLPLVFATCLLDEFHKKGLMDKMVLKTSVSIVICSFGSNQSVWIK